jgi:hypothetical protein
MVLVGEDAPELLTKSIPTDVASLELLVQSPIKLPEE